MKQFNEGCESFGRTQDISVDAESEDLVTLSRIDSSWHSFGIAMVVSVSTYLIYRFLQKKRICFQWAYE